jgi:glycosyltransferase involved in cell wall biosynthesis
LNQIDDNFEVVIVDNDSNDGSEKILKQYVNMNKLRVINRKCSRGKGRQLAFEDSSGDYIIANMDMDDIFKPVLQSLLKFYHSGCESLLMLAISADNPNKGFQNITIGPRELIRDLGGWRDLQYAEDWDLWSRAAKIGKFRYIQFNLSSSLMEKRRENILKKLKNRYIRYRELFRLGRNIFSKDESASLSQYFIVLIARITSVFYESYRDSFNKTFGVYDAQYLHTPINNSEDASRS